MGFLGSIGKAISKGFKAVTGGIGGSVLGSVATGLFNANSAKSAQNDAQDYNTKVLQNRHQWEVADLRAAGLNPILSATNSAGGAGIAAAPAGTMPDLGNAANSAKSVDVQKLGTQNQYKIEMAKVNLESRKAEKMFDLWKSQMESNNAIAQKVISEKLGIDTDNKWKDVLYKGQYGIQQAQIGKLKAEESNAYASAADHYSHIEVNKAEVGRINASMDSIRAAIPKMLEDQKISYWQAEQLKLYVERIKAHPDLYDASIVGQLASGSVKPALDAISGIVNGYGTFKSANKGPTNINHTHWEYGPKNTTINNGGY